MERTEKINLLLDLIEQANQYTKLYDLGFSTITDQQWDNIYFKIIELERELDMYPQNSPTKQITFDVVSALKKVEHNHKMLSLQKTKSLKEAEEFVGKEIYLIMCKMDGLTCSLTYQDGQLVSAETRGNGLIGEDILHNIKHIPSVPKTLPGIQGRVIIDGEIICTYKDFEYFSSEYKNPRNFAAGSIRLLDSRECAKRRLSFVAWDVIEGLEQYIVLSKKLKEIEKFGFLVVPFVSCPTFGVYGDEVEVETIVSHLTKSAKRFGYPIDGMVFKFDHIEYGKSLGETSHHFKNAIAYKFYDETYPTALREIEWSMGRTGQISPIAIFDEIDIDGSFISRASLHNLDILEATLHGHGWKGQKIEVSKRNMIIPQIEWAEDDDERTKYYFEVPAVCPICGSPTKIHADGTSRFLFCENPNCEGKLINQLDHFCGKKGLDIKGLSKATLDRLLEWKYIESPYDIFFLQYHADEWKRKPSFGEKSVNKIIEAINQARKCDLDKFICALGIPLIGSTASKQLANQFKTWSNFIEAINTNYDFSSLTNFGSEMHKALTSFDYSEAMRLIEDCMEINSITENQDEKTLEGLTFVITGKLKLFTNRDAIKNKIESLGGKVAGSVSKNTNYLINNDKESTSSKNRSAKQLGISILTEEEFIETFGISN